MSDDVAEPPAPVEGAPDGMVAFGIFGELVPGGDVGGVTTMVVGEIAGTVVAIGPAVVDDDEGAVVVEIGGAVVVVDLTVVVVVGVPRHTENPLKLGI